MIDGIGEQDAGLATSPRLGITVSACAGTLSLDARFPEETSPIQGVFSYVLADRLRSTTLDGKALMEAVATRVAELTGQRQTTCSWGADTPVRASKTAALHRRQ